jgi:hypothetical protein
LVHAAFILEDHILPGEKDGTLIFSPGRKSNPSEFHIFQKPCGHRLSMKDKNGMQGKKREISVFGI